MATSNPVDERVNRFVEELLELVEQARTDRRATALGIITSMLEQHRLRPNGSSPSAVRPRAKPPAARPQAKPRAVNGRANKPRKTSSSVTPREPEPAPKATPKLGARVGGRHPRVFVVPSGPPAAPPKGQQELPLMARVPVEQASVEATTPEEARDREGRVLEAVRVLMRPTAGEVAGKCGLSNASAYAALRALVESGKVAKTETGRGLEYSLVSSGGIQPFKRNKSAPPPPAASGEEAPPDSSAL